MSAYSATIHKLIHRFLWISQHAPHERRLVRRGNLPLGWRVVKSAAPVSKKGIGKKGVRNHSGSGMADLAAAARFGHRGGTDHRALDHAAPGPHPAADAARAGGLGIPTPGRVERRARAPGE